MAEPDPAAPAVVNLLLVLGFSLVFVILGATASAIGQLISAHLRVLSQIAGVIIIIFGD